MGNVKERYKVAQKNSINSTDKVLVHDCFVSRTLPVLLQGSTNVTDNNETLIINQM